MSAGDKKKRSVPSQKPDPARSKPAPEAEEERDEVAEASWESFPASDPPPWTMRRPGQPAKKPRDDK